ncbi:BN159_2729 family protein [Streptomyces sp. NBC_00377]|uniref:BN159_2729 family protein n=1 Tax=unclassified Streptomyces TaxID=2593676 RepID=UPI002E1AD31D|nr:MULTISPECIES: BN159_2729 family protein [unclassified Streptomyces]
MNGNLPHAARLIHAVLDSVRPEQATAVAHALDSARLLVDPEHSFGVVLHRAPDGGWSPAARPVTELERQALAWDASCARARRVARAVARDLEGHPGPHGIRVEGDRVGVLLRVDDPAQWVRWRAYFGITAVRNEARPRTVTGEGQRDGVRVTVVARGTGTAPPRAPAAAEKRPFRLGAATYDLAVPQRDAHGDVWYFHGSRNQDGMPLLSLDGRLERCSLANVEAQSGPLSPVRGRAPLGAEAPKPAGRARKREPTATREEGGVTPAPGVAARRRAVTPEPPLVPGRGTAPGTDPGFRLVPLVPLVPVVPVVPEVAGTVREEARGGGEDGLPWTPPDLPRRT